MYARQAGAEVSPKSRGKLGQRGSLRRLPGGPTNATTPSRRCSSRLVPGVDPLRTNLSSAPCPPPASPAPGPVRYRSACCNSVVDASWLSGEHARCRGTIATCAQSRASVPATSCASVSVEAERAGAVQQSNFPVCVKPQAFLRFRRHAEHNLISAQRPAFPASTARALISSASSPSFLLGQFHRRFHGSRKASF